MEDITVKGSSKVVGVRGDGQGYASPSIIERRRRILSTARKMIASKGIANISMDEISRRSEVAKRTIYNAFQNKEQLIAAAIHQYFEDYEVLITYHEPPATAERMVEHLAIVAERNFSVRNYTGALLDIYYSADVDSEIREAISEIVAHAHRAWIDRLYAEKQLQPWIDRAGLIEDLVRYRYAVANDWARGRIADADFAPTLIKGVLTMVMGATRPRARRETEEVLRNYERYLPAD